ncbi:MAG: FAD-dependent oxidoreductase [Polyangiaceae bacterium]
MSRSPKVIVIGGGIAGTAAAWRAAALGANVTLISRGAGASALSSGALDHAPWEDLVRASRALGVEPSCRDVGEGVEAFAKSLGIWGLPPVGAPFVRLATLAGRTRPARGRDASLLDLSALPPGIVAVPRVDRAAWDADALARFWNDDPFARSRGLHFKAIDASLLRFDGEHRIGDADLSARHDDPARVAWLAERLRDAFAREKIAPVAVLVGPWLGMESPRAEALSERLGLPAGEALSGAGSPAGLRFTHAAKRLLSKANVRVVPHRVKAIEPPDVASEHASSPAGEPANPRPGENASLRSGESAGLRAPESGRIPESARLAEQRATILLEGADPIRADRIVLACGGLAGGGLVYDPPDTHAGADMPPRKGPAFRFSFEIEANESGRPYLQIAGDRAAQPSSMFGAALDLTAWPTAGQTGSLESVGVAVSEEGLAASYLAAAGDIVAARPRTALTAVESALRAAEIVAG